MKLPPESRSESPAGTVNAPGMIVVGASVSRVRASGTVKISVVAPAVVRVAA